jgi:hypothetical protein
LPEGYAPITVKLSGDRAEVAVHGWLSFLRPAYDNAGHEYFDTSGMEFRVTLFLRNQQGTWTVVKTLWPSNSVDGGDGSSAARTARAGEATP